MSEIPDVLLRYIAGLKAHDVSAIAATVADELAFVTPARVLDRDLFLQMLRALYAAFPDWHYDHDAPRWERDRLAVRWRQGGTHTDPFHLPGLASLPATGRRVRLPEQDFTYRLKNALIVEIRPDPIPGGAPGGILRQISDEAPAL